MQSVACKNGISACLHVLVMSLIPIFTSVLEHNSATIKIF